MKYRRQNPSYTSYTGRKNRQRAYIKNMDEDLLQACKMAAASKSVHSISSENEKQYDKILDALNSGRGYITERQRDLLYFALPSKELKERFDKAVEGEKVARETFKELGD